MSESPLLLSPFLPILKGASFVAIVTGIAKGFEWVDGGLSLAGRQKLSRWLMNVPGEEELDTWAGVFPNLIDRVFGVRAVSWKFFWRSCVASIVAVAVVFTIFATHYGFFWLLQQTGVGGPVESLVRYFITALLLNCVPDYFSVLISRFVVRTMARNPTALRISSLLILDIVATLVVASLSLFLWTILINILVDVLSGHPVKAVAAYFVAHPRVFAHLLYGSTFELVPTRIFVIASLFTSVWVWLYVLASAAIRILHKARFLWFKVVPFLSVEDKPMMAIGRVAGLIGGCSYLTGLAGLWLYQLL
ncbi:MAG TPA: hypothetical protein VL991_14425 [Terracidiphilus sp.]|nr:hypothetical protein [Terracidiphilus sp.]